MSADTAETFVSSRSAPVWSDPIGPTRPGRWISHMLMSVGISFHTEGLQLSSKYGLTRWRWEDMASLAYGDASRVTATRVATFGLVGFGMRKTQTEMAVTVRQAGGSSDQVLLRFFTSEPELAAHVQMVASTVSAAGTLLGMAPAAPAPAAPVPAAPAPAGPAPAGPAPDLARQLRELAKMYYDGVLTAEEFAAAKRQLLG